MMMDSSDRIGSLGVAKRTLKKGISKYLAHFTSKL